MDSECELCFGQDGELDDPSKERSMENIIKIKKFPCGHVFCKKCIIQYINTSDNPYICPHNGKGVDDPCICTIDPNLYVPDLIPSIFKAVCTFCNYNRLEYNKKHVVCNNCNRVFLNKIPVEDLSAMANTLDEEFFKNSVKRCPKCTTPIVKESGCDTMRCANCKCLFSWNLLAIITNKEDIRIHATKEQAKIDLANAEEAIKQNLLTTDKAYHDKSRYIEPSAEKDKQQEKEAAKPFIKITRNFESLKLQTEAQNKDIATADKGSKHIPKVCKVCGKPVGLLGKDIICFKCKNLKKS